VCVHEFVCVCVCEREREREEGVSWGGGFCMILFSPLFA
jgi:hypothetical protein